MDRRDAEVKGGWHGWLLLEPEEGGGATLRTGRETTQPDREDLQCWARGCAGLRAWSSYISRDLLARAERV